MNPEVSHFMDERDEEQEGVAVRVDGDTWGFPGLAGEITKLGDSRTTENKVKRPLLPELKAIGKSGGWNVRGQKAGKPVEVLVTELACPELPALRFLEGSKGRRVEVHVGPRWGEKQKGPDWSVPF
jgi:hypothetical protein